MSDGLKGRLRVWSNDEVHLGRSVRSHEPVYANPAELRSDVRDLLALVEMLERRLRHSEFHRTHHRRAMRRRGKIIAVLSGKIRRQREALKQNGGGAKRLSVHERAAAVHHSLRTEPPEHSGVPLS